MSWNVDIYEVGVQQVKDFAPRDFYSGGLRGCFDLLDEGVYLVVECCAHFGCFSTPCVHYCFQNVQQATYFVLYQDSVQNNPDLMAEHDQVVGYEIWHVVDDVELWLDWELDVAKYKMASGQAVWRVYDCNMPVIGGTPIMELAVLPRTIYHLICRDATGNWFVSDDWYSDGHKFCEGLDTAIDNGYYVVTSDVFDQCDAVTIMLGDTAYELDEYDGSVFEVMLRESC